MKKEITKQEIKEAWRTILLLLQQSGYDFLYKDEIDILVKVIRHVTFGEELNIKGEN